ncbi:MAG TPA: hypothetical protein VIY08_00375 [Candidatus Nitrosocosmicus sp.]
MNRLDILIKDTVDNKKSKDEYIVIAIYGPGKVSNGWSMVLIKMVYKNNNKKEDLKIHVAVN